ncbi:hypothetical protein [Phenylobacterium soli]|uniref:Uncharacterized protein n=2 Tax=Phenylobacterium soli TaxID=2170551 RepID=A0A328A9S8_9CAUL|nr:hypothetical protein [Phenylobacterium soli]RAK51137.1 hypothetical protein DJ017_19430 [Phenylobacterium soli]
MIPRVAFVLVLCSLAAVVVVAAAAAGRFDRLPPQPYFPRQFAQASLMYCDPEGARSPDQARAGVRSEQLVDNLEANWFGSHLRAAQERSLWQPASELRGRTLRFLWLRSFHAPAVIRIDEPARGTYWLTATLLQGNGGYEPGRIDRRVTRRLSPEEAEAYEKAYSQLASLPRIGCGNGADGSEWIIETRDQGRYSLLKRWTPASGTFHDLGVLLIGFTGWNPKPIY